LIGLFPHVRHKPQSSPRHRPDETLLLAAVADGAASGIDPVAQGRFRDDPPTPDRLQHLVLADHLVPVANEVKKQVEDLRLDVDGLAASPKLTSGRIESAVAEQKTHSRLPQCRLGQQ
jgi:hypothetical protein